ncbi:MAG: hypothetical protein ABH834_01335 [Candidatus Altiarchaeota archaeon]
MKAYSVYGVEFLLESDFPRLVSEMDMDFGCFASRGDRPAGIVSVKKKTNVSDRIPDEAVFERRSWFSEVYSFQGKTIILNSKKSFLVEVPSKDERGFVCYAERYSHHLFCTVRNLVKYMTVSLLEDEGVYYIHACAVRKKGKTAVVIAKPNFGKTRSLLSLINRDFRILTDDVVLLREDDARILPFVIRANVDSGHIEAFPKVKAAIEKLGIKMVKKWNFWFIPLTELFDIEKGEYKPDFIVNIKRWNSEDTKTEEADKGKMLAFLLASYSEFGSGVYFNSTRTRADLFRFYSKMLDEVKTYDFYVGRNTEKFAEKFDELFA